MSAGHPPTADAGPSSRPSHAGTVAAGILSSRVLGLVRQATVSFFFGLGAHTDVFEAALRAPNLLQNLLGEGTISASFIPIYSRLLDEGRAREAGRFAGAIFGLLVAAAATLVLLGIALAEPLVTLLTPGFIDDAAKVAAGELNIDRFDLTVRAVRIIFPMTGMLVLSAWALGVLNSHRRFFVPYVAPAVWNIAIISAVFGTATVVIPEPLQGDAVLSVETLTQLLFAAFVGALVGGVLQFLVQLPLVFHLMSGFRLSLSTKVEGVREALAAFGPVVAGRGVSQISGYLDVLLASLLAAGALGSLLPALMLYLLPVSLFGQSVAAAELPELSRLSEDQSRSFSPRLDGAMRQTLFLTVPAAVGYLCFGFLIVGGLLRRGEFGLTDTWLVYAVLAGYSLGLVATTLSRLLQNGFWALRDTRTPAKIAVVRLLVSTAVAVPAMFALDRLSVSETLGFAPEDGPLYLGAAGLALGASVGAWVELWRLRTALRRQLGSFAVPWRRLLGFIGLSGGVLLPAAGLWWLLADWPALPLALVVVGVYGGGYLGLAHLLHLPELDAWTGRLLGRVQKH